MASTPYKPGTRWLNDEVEDLAYDPERSKELLAEVGPLTLRHLDTQPPPAAVLEYTVTAVDSTGNESEPSAAERIRTQ